MATISITIPDDKITEIVAPIKDRPEYLGKTNNQIIKQVMIDSLKSRYRSIKTDEAIKTIMELDI